MKAFTLYQPYATAIARGLKNTKRYGINDIEYGEIIAICELQDCIEMTKAFYANKLRIDIFIKIVFKLFYCFISIVFIVSRCF